MKLRGGSATFEFRYADEHCFVLYTYHHQKLLWFWQGEKPYGEMLTGLNEAMLGVADVVRQRDAWATFLNAIPAGFLIAMVAWVLPNAREQAFFVIFAITFVVALGGFSHSILGSVEAFMLLYAGKMGLAQTLFGVLLPAILGNLVGGAGLFALLAHAQVREEVSE